MALIIRRKPKQRVRVKVGKEVLWIEVLEIIGQKVALVFEGDSFEIQREEIVCEEPEE